jgi:outer membrane protein, heavy metal efflux system
MKRYALAYGFGVGLAILVAGPSVVAAQDLLTEAQVVAAVRTSNYGLNAARAAAGAEAQRPGQVRWPFPMVEVMPMIGSIRDGEPGAQVMARQVLPWPGRLAADRAARARMADALAFEADARELDAVAMARMTYAELWGLQEQAARIDEFGRQLDLYREAALAQYAAGRGPQQAVLGIQVEAAMLAQRAEVLAEERGALVARLAALSGGRVEVSPGDRLAPPSTAPAVAEADYEALLAQHPMVQAGRAMQASEQAMAEMNRTMLRPDFTLGVNLNLSRMAFDRMYGQEPIMPAVGVMLPLWRGGIRARIQESELRATQRELETAGTRVQLEAEFRDVLSQLSRVRSRIAVYEGTLRPQVRQTLDASLAGYRAGTTRFLELLDTQRMALEVELDLVMAYVRAAELAARLDAAVGRMSGAAGTDAGNYGHGVER